VEAVWPVALISGKPLLFVLPPCSGASSYNLRVITYLEHASAEKLYCPPENFSQSQAWPRSIIIAAVYLFPWKHWATPNLGG
jgi:hypothetical protein